MKRIAISIGLVLACVLAAPLLEAQSPESVSLMVQPRTILPLGDSSNLLSWNLGGLALVRFSPTETAPFIFGAGLGFDGFATQALTSLTTISAEAHSGAYLPMGKLLGLEATLGAGFSWETLQLQDASTSSGPALRLAGDVAVRFNLDPAFALELTGGYVTDLGLFQGLSLGIRTIFNLENLGNNKTYIPKLRVDRLDSRAVFPVFYSWYDTNPLGRIGITNLEPGTVTNLQASFNMKEYMSSPKVVGKAENLGPGEKLEMDLTALFRSDLLQQVEQSSVAATITVSYQFRGQNLSTELNVPFTVMDRNAMTWDDDRKAAAFISAKDPTVLELARNTVALVRDLGDPLIAPSIRNAAAVFTALGSYGITYNVDPKTSYQARSGNKFEPDYLQFPRQTLSYRAGDCDDLSILYCSLLEALGIPTAFITVPGHIYVAFDSGLSPREASKVIADSKDYIVVNDQVWIPVEITLVGKDFFEAWKQGIREWQSGDTSGNARLIAISNAWEAFPAVAMPDQQGSILDKTRIKDKAILASSQKSIHDWARLQITRLEAQLRLRPEGPDSPVVLNAIGTLYARFGDYETAASFFLKAANGKTAYFPAIFNMGNLYYAQGQFTKALPWFNKATALKPQDPRLLLAVARNQFELARYPEAQKLYTQAVAADPEIGQEFAYLAGAGDSGTRADNANDRRKTSWAE